MPQIILNIPQTKMPVLKEFMQIIGLKEKRMKTALSPSMYASTRSDVNHEHATHNYNALVEWEFFCNELEFE